MYGGVLAEHVLDSRCEVVRIPHMVCDAVKCIRPYQEDRPDNSSDRPPVTRS
jgi:hypothetical protein